LRSTLSAACVGGAILRSQYDIVVVGAGPAGSTAARYAAQNGCSVLMLEKDREIGVPVRCGEAVEESGLRNFLEPKEIWFANRIVNGRIIAPDGTTVTVNHNEKGYILNRKVFDLDLAIMAAQAGVEILTKAYVYDLIKTNGAVNGIKVKYLGKDYQIGARIVIAADGIESRVGRWAGLKTNLQLHDIESCAQMTIGNIDVDRNSIDLFFSSKFASGGYAWVFPKDSHTANVGVGILGKNNAKKSAMEYLKEFVAQKFPTASTLVSVVGSVSCAPYLKELVTDSLMIVGDAAHQANPISGGGIIRAIWAAQIAGEVAAHAVKDNDVTKKRLQEYSKRWYKAGGVSHIRAYRIKEMIAKITDDDLNKIAAKINELPTEKRTLINIFKVALLNHPKLIPDLIKVFMS
jgi:digeranylgeranylglycerophospholipid reductase